MKNLTESLLDEGVVPNKIPTLEKMILGTNLKILSCRKKEDDQIFTFSMAELAQNLSQNDPTKIVKAPVISKTQRERNWTNYKRSYRISCSETNKTRASLKEDIRSLLKVAAKLRQEDLENNQQKLKEINQPKSAKKSDDSKYVTMDDVEPFKKSE
ncbi:unnamed protein product [Moneuplotes crassus]|uniref:Uncharacterized protein n=1 Tax=Euplotes crassus TaxID=5936 RepID=A0AAD1UT01_EUPCR|nr:unnamed protein product [Moneuplotes crassus]